MLEFAWCYSVCLLKMKWERNLPNRLLFGLDGLKLNAIVHSRMRVSF
jgi:hypothetical protein